MVAIPWNFKRQFTFEVDCELGGSFFAFDSPIPDYGVHWFDGGDTITASVDPMVDSIAYRIYCLGYFGTGSVDTGCSYSWNGILEEPSFIQWIISIEHPICSLLVISEHGDCVPPVGGWNYFLYESEFEAFTSSCDSSDTALGIVYNCIGWRGTGCVPATGPIPYVPPYHICAITCTTSGTLEWLWDTVATRIDEESVFPDNFSLSTHPQPLQFGGENLCRDAKSCVSTNRGIRH